MADISNSFQHKFDVNTWLLNLNVSLFGIFVAKTIFYLIPWFWLAVISLTMKIIMQTYTDMENSMRTLKRYMTHPLSSMQILRVVQSYASYSYGVQKAENSFPIKLKIDLRDFIQFLN